MLPGAVGWQLLPAPASVRWRDEVLRRRPAPERPAIELHLVPVPESRLEMRRIAVLGDELAALGRTRRLFTAREELEAGHDDRAAWARAPGRTGPAGLAMGRNGQRSAWQPLPDDPIGSVLDPDDLVQRVVRLLSLLAAIEVPEPSTVAPAIAVAPAALLSEGRVADMPRSSGSLRMNSTPPRAEAEDSLPFGVVREKSLPVAEELVARLMTAFRA
jgi:hypothetical protein